LLSLLDDYGIADLKGKGKSLHVVVVNLSLSKHCRLCLILA